MGWAYVKVVNLPIKIGGETPEAAHFHGWGTRWCHLCFTVDGAQGQWRLSFLLLLPPFYTTTYSITPVLYI